MLSILHRRAADSRPVVRKAAISALEAVLLTAQSDASNAMNHITADDLQIFYDGCMDSSLAIRKQSLQSISRLYRQSGPGVDLILTKAWLGAVLPLSADREVTVQDKALEAVDELMLQPIIAAIK